MATIVLQFMTYGPSRQGCGETRTNSSRVYPRLPIYNGMQRQKVPLALARPGRPKPAPGRQAPFGLFAAADALAAS